MSTPQNTSKVTPVQQHQQFGMECVPSFPPVEIIDETLLPDPAASSSSDSENDQLPSPDFVPTKPTPVTRQKSFKVPESCTTNKTSRPPLARVYWNPLDWCLGTKRGQSTVMLLGAITLVVMGAVAWGGTPGNADIDSTFAQAIWLSWGLFFDPGTQTGLAPDDPLSCQLVAVAFSIFGFMFNLVFLGVVVDIVREQMDYYEKLRARVVANGHTLVLGWSDKTLFLLQELINSMAAEGGGEIVLLVNWDEFEVRQDINLAFAHGKALEGSTITVRQGDPTESSELDRVSIISAATVIVLGGSGKPVASDQHVLRVVLAAMALEQQVSGRMLCEIRIPDNLPVIDDMLSGTGHGFVTRDAILRVLCLSSLCPAVGETYIDAMSFADGEEVYLMNYPELCGFQFDHISPLFPDAVLFGVWSPSCTTNKLLMPPAVGYKLQPGDQLLMLSSDLVDSITPTGTGLMQQLTPKSLQVEPSKYKGRRSSSDVGRLTPEDITEAKTRAANLPDLLPEITKALLPDLAVDEVKALSNRAAQGKNRMVIVGWAADIPEFLITLNGCVPEHTEVCILSEKAKRKREYVLQQAGIDLDGEGLCNLNLVHHYGQPTSASRIQQLPLDTANSVVILADDLDEDESPMVSDSVNLTITVLVHKDLVERGRLGPNINECTIVCELLDNRTQRILMKNKVLSEKAHFFHSNLLETGMFATAAKEPIVAHALGVLLQPTDSAVIATVAVDAYCTEELYTQGISFIDLADKVRARGEVLLGWREEKADDMMNFGQLELNPKNKKQNIVFSSADDLIVLRAADSPYNAMGW